MRADALVNKLKLKNVIMESDSAIVVSKLNTKEADRSVHGPLIEDIKRVVREVDDLVVEWSRLFG
jgi:hypothetical protein